MDPLEQARQFFFAALDHHNHHRLVEAEALYLKALALVPERVSVLVNLTAVLLARHRISEAQVYCLRALAIEPANAEAREHLALCRAHSASPAAALAEIDRALAMQPLDPELHNNRGAQLRSMGRDEEALASLNRSLELDPNSVGALSNRASLLVTHQPQAALADYLRALRVDPDFPPAGQGLIDLLCSHALAHAVPDNELDSLLVRAIRVPWARPQTIAPLLIARLHSRPVLQKALARIEQGGAQGLSLSDCLGEDADALAADAVLLALLENALVADPLLERYLTRLRHVLLDHTFLRSDAPTDPVLLRLHCALASQCHLNEYLYESSGSERAGAALLGERLQLALQSDARLSPHMIAAVASYLPLHRVPGSDRLIALTADDATLRALVERQVVQPEAERRLGQRMPALTRIKDAVSRLVQQQYEDNPYPRWVSLPAQVTHETLASYLRRRVPAADPGRVADRTSIDALVAGCGTGQHPLELALRIDGIRVLAIDLSRASLGYASRMATRLGLDQIEFAQADLLELTAMERRFDLIDASGVLHHLAEPERGLRVLRGLLHDDGLLRVSLYSELARRGVVAARAHIEAHGHPATFEGIRRCRRELLALPDGDLRRRVVAIPDFYSTSECRDLLFHVQEHRFTLPAIGALLKRCALELVGLELDRAQNAAFRRRYPDPSTLNDLERWHDFETEHPDTFAAMVTLWLRKPA